MLRNYKPILWPFNLKWWISLYASNLICKSKYDLYLLKQQHEWLIRNPLNNLSILWNFSEWEIFAQYWIKKIRGYLAKLSTPSIRKCFCSGWTQNYTIVSTWNGLSARKRIKRICLVSSFWSNFKAIYLFFSQILSVPELLLFVFSGDDITFR